MQSPPELILASTSRYRGELLNRLGITYQAIAPGVDETRRPDEAPRELAIRLAREKALAVARQRPQAWVIGSDQVAVVAVDGTELALGKPGSAQRCIEQLLMCSGRALQFVTAVAVARLQDAALHEFVDVTRVVYRRLDRATIERYVTREAPWDCAGGFKSEALGISLCDSVESHDPTALIGLPLIRLAALLRDAGYLVP